MDGKLLDLYKSKLIPYISSAKSKGYSSSLVKEKLQSSKVPSDILDLLLKEVYGKDASAKDASVKDASVKDASGSNSASSNPSKDSSSKEFDRDKDVFTQEDFKKLENKETKGLFSRFKKDDSNKDQVTEKKEEEIDYTDRQISKKINIIEKEIEEETIKESKIEGKLEVITEKNKELQEELENVREKVGELRSTVLGRERLFNKLEDDFTTVKFVVNTFKPDVIDKRFSSIDTDVLKIQSQVEKIDLSLKNVQIKLSEYTSLISSIKSFENVIEKLSELKKEEGHIEKLKLEIDKKSARIDAISQNLQETVGKINEVKTVSDSNKEAVKELLMSVSKMEAQNDFFVKKDDFTTLKTDLQLLKKVIYDKEVKKTLSSNSSSIGK